jgi:diguanylate cyclase (GGDEF)-like protein
MREEVAVEIDAHERRGARFAVPFLLPTLYVVRVVLGGAYEWPGVKTAFWVAVALVVFRWLFLMFVARSIAGATIARRRLQFAVFTLSAWGTSAGFAGIYLTAAPALDAVRVMTLTVVASGVCAVSMVSMAASLWSYSGYVAIHLGAVIVLMLELPAGKLMPGIPFAAALYAVALAAISTRSHLELREKLRLAFRLRSSALRDALTGLSNRHFMTEHVARLAMTIVDEWTAGGLRRRSVPSRSLAFFIIDLDHFKRINDVHGHAVGDDVLVAFARLAQSAVRTPDVVARWGGEEFLVLMQVNDRESLTAIGARIRKRVEGGAVALPRGGSVTVTCSIGACLFPLDTERPGELTWEDTLILADAALYEAKAAGRNQTRWLRPGPTKPSPREVLAAVRDGTAQAMRAGVVVLDTDLSKTSVTTRAAAVAAEVGEVSGRA